MNKIILKDILGWGIVLWLIGYVLGLILFFIIPTSLIGWVIMPIGAVITSWVAVKKVKSESLRYYLILAIVWTVIAVAFDYFFIIKMLKPADGYYKPDVFLYYLLTFLIPLIVGLWKTTNKSRFST